MKKVEQGYKDIYKTSKPGDKVLIKDTYVTNGALFHGHGAKKVEIYNSYTMGKVKKYRICNFDAPCEELLMDFSQTDHFFEQGPEEAAIRLMQIKYAMIVGLKVRGYYYEPGKYWKQCLQIRSGHQMNFKNLEVDGPTDIGWMTDPNIPIAPLDEVNFLNCVFKKWPHVTPGVKKIVFKDCVIEGHTVNKTENKTYP